MSRKGLIQLLCVSMLCWICFCLTSYNKVVRDADLIKPSGLNSNDEFIMKYNQLYPNVPVHLLQNRTEYSSYNGYVQFPDLYDLEFSNTYWQTLKLKNNGTTYIYSAYYDNRDLVDNAIRINTVIRNEDIPSVKYCQLWFPNERIVVISNISSAIQMSPWKGHTNMRLLSCQMPLEFKDKVPAAVSLVESECDVATNLLTVHYNQPESEEKQQDFAICIKALLYPNVDLSFQFVQYIELAKILGIHRIYIYQYNVHPNISATLRYYEKQGTVQLTPFTIPGTFPNLPAMLSPLFKNRSSKGKLANFRYMKLNNERAAHNDCFYMNMYKYRYIAFFDADEIMIPSAGKSWKEAIEDVIKREKVKIGSLYTPPSGYRIPMGHFKSSLRDSLTPAIPQYMSMLQNVNRTGMINRYKQLIDTERNLGISNHVQQECIGKCQLHNLDDSDLFLAHYREGECYDPRLSLQEITGCNQTVTDTRIWHYKEDMIKNVDDALKAIGLL